MLGGGRVGGRLAWLVVSVCTPHLTSHCPISIRILNIKSVETLVRKHYMCIENCSASSRGGDIFRCFQDFTDERRARSDGKVDESVR